MSKLSKTAEETPARDSQAALSIANITLPSYETGGISTDLLANHLSHMLENYESMNGELFARANGTARSATKFWDTIRGLERNSIEREKLALKIGASSGASPAA